MLQETGGALEHGQQFQSFADEASADVFGKYSFQQFHGFMSRVDAEEPLQRGITLERIHLYLRLPISTNWNPRNHPH